MSTEIPNTEQNVIPLPFVPLQPPDKGGSRDIASRQNNTIAANTYSNLSILYPPLPIDDSWETVNSALGKIKPRRALSPELVRVSPTSYALTAPDGSLSPTGAVRERDQLRQQQALVAAQVYTVQNQIKHITSTDVKLKDKKNKKKIEQLQNQLLESERAKATLEARIENLGTTFNLRGAALAFTAEQQIAAIQNEADAVIKTFVAASNEEKSALAHSFELYKTQLQRVFDKEARDYTDKQVQAASIKIDEVNEQIKQSEQLRLQAEAGYLQAAQLAKSHEIERQRLLESHNELVASHNLLIAEAQHIHNSAKHSEERARALSDELIIIKREKTELLDKVQRLDAIQEQLQERIKILESSLKSVNDQLQQAPAEAENYYTKYIQEENNKVVTLSNQLTTLTDRYTVELQAAHDQINSLNINLQRTQEIIERYRVEKQTALNQQRIQSPIPLIISPTIDALASAPAPTPPILNTTKGALNCTMFTAARPSEKENEMSDIKDLVRAFKDGFDNIRGNDDKNNIPIFRGSSQDQPVKVWLKEAESMARSNEWSKELTKRYLGSRMRGAAMTWLDDRKAKHPDESYEAWRQSFITTFTNAADIDRLKIKFNNLSQKANQSTRSFVYKIMSTYKMIYGECAAEDHSATKLKNDVLLSVFFKGLRPNIKDAMYGRLKSSDYTWDDATEAAIDAENTIVKRELNETKTVNNIDRIGLDVLSDQQKKIDALQAELKELKLSQDKSSGKKASMVANVDHSSRDNKHPKNQKQIDYNLSGGYQSKPHNQNFVPNNNGGQYYNTQATWQLPNTQAPRPQYNFRAPNPNYQNYSQGFQYPVQQFQNSNQFRGYSPRQSYQNGYAQQQYRPRAPGNYRDQAPPNHGGRPAASAYQTGTTEGSEQQFQCYACGIIGHKANRCPQRQAGYNGARPRQ